jgi:hypothetical protein
MLTTGYRVIRGFALIAAGIAGVGRSAVAQHSEDVPFTLAHLALDLRIDYGRRAVDGTATLHLRNVSDRARSDIPLLLNRLMTVSRVLDRAGDSVAFEQRITVFRDDSIRQVNALVVTPNHPVPPGDSVAIVVHYGGILVGYTETGALYIRDRVNQEFTIIREDAYAFPVVGVPLWTANRTAVRELFTFAARITVPAEVTVAMGGEPIGRAAQDSLVAWTYRSTDPLPFLNITIAPYRILESPPARIFYFPADSAGARMVEHAIASSMERLTRWYGPLGRSHRLSVMEIPDGFGSQASLVAGILQSKAAFVDRTELRQLYHELSHLWNPRDLDLPSPRWNEGLASFLEWRMAAELDGWTDWEGRTSRAGQSLLRLCAGSAGCEAPPFAEFGRAGLTTRSYSVGMLMFYALYEVLGPEEFDRVYRAFFQKHRETGARSLDLVAAFRRADSRSERIFEDWYFTTRWYSRLRAGETLRQMVEQYSRK